MKVLRASLFLFTLLALSHPLCSQACQRCSEMTLPPTDTEPGGLLRDYLGGENGHRGNDCWVHCHPNGRDFVITPNDWGAQPHTDKKSLINLAFEAITDSRRVMEELGNLQRSMYFLFSDNTDDGSYARTFWPVGDECWIEAGIEDMRALSDSRHKYVFAHEIGHCFLMDNIEGHAAPSPGYEEWWDECGSEYLSSIVYPSDNMEHRYARGYRLDAPFIQPYKAYVLFHYYALQNDQDALLRLIQGLYDHPGKANRLSFLRSINFGPFFHKFNYRFIRQEIPDAGGGTIPNSGWFSFQSYPLKTLQNVIEFDEIFPEQANLFHLTIPAGYDAVLSPIENSALEVTIVANGVGMYPWASTHEVDGSCSDETSIALLITHLSEDPIRDAKLNYQLTPKTNCCEGIGGFTQAIDPCLIGRWRVDYSGASYQGMAEISGDITIDLKQEPNGQLKAEFDIRRQYDSDDYDIHKGIATGCLVAYPTGSRGGGATYLKIMNGELGLQNRHFECCTRRGDTTDITLEIAQWLRHFVFGYLRCDGQTIEGLGGVRLVKME